MANVEQLLRTSKSPSLLDELDLMKPQRQKLIEARKDIRQHLRDTFSKTTEPFLRDNPVKPVFYTQGSYVYGTINRPAHTPPQQIDLDDGIYLPITFLENAGTPNRAAELFIEFVDKALKKLAEEKEWDCITTIPTCTRLILDDESHVDIPMYAIPDAEMEKLKETALMKAEENLFAEGRGFTAGALDDNWALIPMEKVHLAHRKNGWIVSDPRIIKEWFDQRVNLFGNQLQRVCRYLKAWRDQNAPVKNQGLDNVSSILLMACAVRVFEEYSEGGRDSFGRDDEALRMVVRHVPQLLEIGVADPADSSVQMTDRLSHEDRNYAISSFKTFHAGLDQIIDTCQDTHRAVDLVTQLFGPRVPQRPDLVKVAKAGTPRAEVEGYTAATVAAPTIKRTKSA